MKQNTNKNMSKKEEIEQSQKSETFLAYGRLIVVSSLENARHWAEIVKNGSKTEEKFTMGHIEQWASGFLSKLDKLNKNPLFKQFYDDVQYYKGFSSEMLGLSLTVNQDAREEYLRHCARWINYLNARKENPFYEHPEWMSYGEPSTAIEIEDASIFGADKAIPDDGEICAIKQRKDSFPKLTYYEHAKRIFVEDIGSSEILYHASEIYKWRSLNS